MDVEKVDLDFMGVREIWSKVFFLFLSVDWRGEEAWGVDGM